MLSLVPLTDHLPSAANALAFHVKHSFANTEGTEDLTEQILDINTPRHAGKFRCGLSHIFGNKLKPRPCSCNAR